jgi:hypothetical protein
MDLWESEIVEQDDEAFDPSHRKATKRKLLIITIPPCVPSARKNHKEEIHSEAIFQLRLDSCISSSTWILRISLHGL